MLDEGQGGHLSINPLQTKSLIPFSKSSRAHTACPLRKARREAAQGGVTCFGCWEPGTASRSPVLCCWVPRSRPAPERPLPSTPCPVSLPGRHCLSPPFNKDRLNDCSSLIRYCRIQRNPDFTSQLTRKSDSPYRLMS